MFFFLNFCACILMREKVKDGFIDFFFFSLQVQASKHQEEVKSAETEFIEGQREHERSRTLQNETH